MKKSNWLNFFKQERSKGNLVGSYRSFSEDLKGVLERFYGEAKRILEFVEFRIPSNMSRAILDTYSFENYKKELENTKTEDCKKIDNTDFENDVEILLTNIEQSMSRTRTKLIKLLDEAGKYVQFDKRLNIFCPDKDSQMLCKVASNWEYAYLIHKSNTTHISQNCRTLEFKIADDKASEQPLLLLTNKQLVHFTHTSPINTDYKYLFMGDQWLFFDKNREEDKGKWFLVCHSKGSNNETYLEFTDAIFLENVNYQQYLCNNTMLMSFTEKNEGYLRRNSDQNFMGDMRDSKVACQSTPQIYTWHIQQPEYLNEIKEYKVVLERILLPIKDLHHASTQNPTSSLPQFKS